MIKFRVLQSGITKGSLLCLSLFAANCSGKTYSTLLQPFDLVFGVQNGSGNPAVSGSLIAATPLTNTRVMLTFSKPVTLASAQSMANYRITAPNGNVLHLLAATRDPNNSNIIFIDTIPQVAGSQYTVTVANIAFADGASLGNATATFTAPNNADQTGPQFGSVSVSNASTVEVYFNEAVSQTNPATGVAYPNGAFGGFFDIYQDAGCSVSNVNVTSAVRDASNNAKVILTTALNLTNGQTYYVCATANVRDIWGNSNTTVIANSAVIASGSFVYHAPTPRVVSAVSASPTSVLVTFDQAMTTTGAFVATGSYTFTGCGALSSAGATVTPVSSTQALLSPVTVGSVGTCTVTVSTAVTSAAGAALTVATNFALFNYAATVGTDTTAPAVVGITTSGANTVIVTFSENVTGASIADFSFSPALNVTNVSCTNNVCTLTTADQGTTPYALSITSADGGIQDLATPSANTLNSGSTTFTGDGKPYIIGIFPDDANTIYVQWSEAIDTTTGADYLIPGFAITAALVPSSPSDMVKLTLSPAMTAGDPYTLTLNTGTNTVTDTSTNPAGGNPAITTISINSTFTGPSATTAPLMTGATSPSPTTILVTFNEPLNNATIAPGDFASGGVGCPSGAITSAVQIQAGVVQLIFPGQVADAGPCSVTLGALNAVYDLAGNGSVAGITTNYNPYIGTGSADTTAPTIASVISLSNTRIQVFFSEPMKIGANGMDTLSRYSTSPSLTLGPVVTCASNTSSCIIDTSAQSTQTYTLSISSGIEDFNNVATTGAISSTFIGTGGSATAPTLFTATLINSTTVELSFSEIMHLNRAQNTANYSVSGGLSVTAAVRQADATKVRLTLSPGAFGSSNSYSVTGDGASAVTGTTPLTDFSNNALGTPNSATFSGSASAPAVTDLATASDLGVSNTDNLTSSSAIPGMTFNGTVAANTTVMLYDDGDPVATAISNTSGAYSIVLNSVTSLAAAPTNNQFTVATVGPTGLVSDQSPTLPVQYDSSAPSVQASAAPADGLGVTSSVANGAYGPGSVVPVTVKFTDTVYVDTTGGTPYLQLATGTPATTNVSYTSGSGTDTLTFTFTTIAGNVNADLDYTAQELQLNGGTIKDLAGNNASVDLANSGANGSLGGNKNINVVAAPTATISYNQSGNTNGTVRAGTVTITASYLINPGSAPTIGIVRPGNGTGDIANGTAMTTVDALTYTYVYTVNALSLPNYNDGTATVTLSTGSSGNTFTIDTTNPVAAASVTVAGYINATSVNTTYTNGSDTNFSTHNVKACTSNDCATGCVGGSTDLATPATIGSLVDAASYYTCVQSVDLAGNVSAFTASATPVVVDTTNPTAPSGVTPPTYTTATTVTGVTYSSGTDANFSTHNVKACTSNDCATGCVGATTDAASPVDVTGLSNGSAYYICVQTLDLATNTSAFVPSATTVTVDTTNPAAPSGVSVPTYVNATSVTVTYTDGTDTNFSTHNVKACTSNDCATGCVGAATDAASPATVSGLTTGTAYYACLQSVDLAGRTSAFVPSAAAVTVDTTNPAAPSAVTVPSYINTTFVNTTYTNGTDANFSTHNVKACTSNDCATGCVGATTDAASPVTISSLVAGTSYYACIQSLDLATNTSAFVASSGTVTVDTTAPTGYSVAIDQTVINNGNQAALSFTFTGAEVGATYNYTISSSGGGTNVTGSGTVASAGQQITGINVTGLGDGTLTLSVTLTDPATNAGTAATNNKTKDVALPVISAWTPTAGPNHNSTTVSFTFSEDCASGSVTWERTGGTADVNHIQALTGSELNSGAHTNIVLTNNPTLVGGSIYTIRWNCTDAAGNVAIERSVANLTYNNVAPTIGSAETLDTDNDGKIDTYRIALSRSVADSSFPGYSANALGTSTVQWLIAGYTNVRLMHGTAVSANTGGAYTDTADDAVIYLRFDENVLTCSAATQVGCDTDAKPDLTTTATPGLTGGGLPLVQVNTATVIEADGAKPILVAARSLGATSADAIFSEPVETTTAQTATNYTVNNGITISSASRDATNTNMVHLVTSAQTGGTTYLLTVNTNVKDLANFDLNASANTANFDGVIKPVVSSIVTQSATTLLITFNEAVTFGSAQCASQSACALIYQNLSLPVFSAVATPTPNANSATYILTVNPMVEGQAYTTTVLQNTVTSVVSAQQMGNTNNSATFNGDGRPAVNISADNSIASGCPTGPPIQSRVIIQYDQAVLIGAGANSAETAANYTIPNTSTDSPQGCVNISQPCASGTNQTATSVTSYGGNKFGINFPAPFDSDPSQYVLKISNVRDLNSNAVAVPTNLTFQCGNDTTAPSLTNINVVSATATSTVILLTFSESLASVEAQTAANYGADTLTPTGAGIISAALQANTAQVQITFSPALSNGGHQLRAINLKDLATPSANTIANNGINNVQPFIVNAPTGFSGGPWFTDPFGDGTPSGFIASYDGKLYLGADKTGAKLFEINFGLTASQTIQLDSDGVAGLPTTGFGSTDTPININGVTSATGVDFIYSACMGRDVNKYLSGSSCSSAVGSDGFAGREYLFIGSRNTPGSFDDLFYTRNVSSATTTFTFTNLAGLESQANTFRLGNMHAFKEYLYIANGDKGSGGPPYLSRVCMNANGCTGSVAFGNVVQLRGRYITRIGKDSYRDNSASEGTQKYANIDSIYEYDADGPSGTGCTGSTNCESQLYLANGGWCSSCNLTVARNGTTGTPTTVGDGGIVRTTLAFSTKASPPPQCPGPANDATICHSTNAYSATSYYDDVTPASNAKWYGFLSIPPPTDPAIEWQNMSPVNTPVPSTWAIPYMRKAPNGDLYALRNACSTVTLQEGVTFASNGKQVCPPGNEVVQLWMMKSCTTASQCPPGPNDWVLVAENAATGQSNMAGTAAHDAACGTAPNKCLSNIHFTLLEVVGNYLYIGYDNKLYGANVWRTNMAAVPSGTAPTLASFTMVNNIGLDGSTTNQRIFSHTTVSDSGKDWLIVATRDGSAAMKLYRTANDEN